MVNMGFTRVEIEDSLTQNKYDDVTATYLLLGRRTAEVGFNNVCSLGLTVSLPSNPQGSSDDVKGTLFWLCLNQCILTYQVPKSRLPCSSRKPNLSKAETPKLSPLSDVL